MDQETADLEVSGGDSQTDREELSHSITDLEAQVDTLHRAESLALEKVTTLEDELKNLKTLEEVWHHCFVLFLSLCLCLVVFVLLSLSCCLCLVVFVLLSLSCCLCLVVFVLLSLSCCFCLIVFVLLPLYHSP